MATRTDRRYLGGGAISEQMAEQIRVRMQRTDPSACSLPAAMEGKDVGAAWRFRRADTGAEEQMVDRCRRRRRNGRYTATCTWPSRLASHLQYIHISKYGTARFHPHLDTPCTHQFLCLALPSGEEKPHLPHAILCSAGRVVARSMHLELKQSRRLADQQRGVVHKFSLGPPRRRSCLLVGPSSRHIAMI